jgi:acyl-CoA reductase-like NAD-dependent aldehyde dehydrogenase
VRRQRPARALRRDVHDELLAGLCVPRGARRLGDPLDPATEIGPLVTRDRADRVEELVDDAVAAGATRHCGGRCRCPA